MIIWFPSERFWHEQIFGKIPGMQVHILRAWLTPGVPVHLLSFSRYYVTRSTYFLTAQVSHSSTVCDTLNTIISTLGLIGRTEENCRKYRQIPRVAWHILGQTEMRYFLQKALILIEPSTKHKRHRLLLPICCEAAKGTISISVCLHFFF